ncbi:DUF4232 domain-containing protein [Streptomyces sp. NPDC127190]|uniref:DUF4232 domain-containing protein n=1 Tax=unclassified Streptomyces TaxID=2593676 RepID=UPI00363F2DDA
MSGFRTTRTRLAAAAATTVLAALSLTACNNGSGTKDEGAAPTASTTAHHSGSAGPSGAPSHSSGATPTTAGSTPSAHSTTGSTPSAHSSAPKPPGSSGKPVICEGSNTRTVAAPLNRPVNHMLLTVTNTGTRTCYLYGYPAVRFGEAQAVPPVIKESHPQAVVTLKPGESGYASVNLSATDGQASHGHTVNSLTVYFYGASGNGSVGAAARPSLPAKGVYVDDSLKVTYWQQSMDDALNW